VSRSKRLCGVADAAPSHLGHRDGGRLAVQSQLIQSLVFLLLSSDVGPNLRLIPSYRRHEVSSCPKVLAYEIALPLSVNPRQMNRALPLHEADHL
jgi:hypothetical protein